MKANATRQIRNSLQVYLDQLRAREANKDTDKAIHEAEVALGILGQTEATLQDMFRLVRAMKSMERFFGRSDRNRQKSIRRIREKLMEVRV